MSRDFLAWVFRGVIAERARVLREAWRPNVNSRNTRVIASMEKINSKREEDYLSLLLREAFNHCLHFFNFILHTVLLKGDRK